MDAKDISKKVKTGIKTKGMSGKPIATEAPYGYMKDPDNKDYWIIDEEAAVPFPSYPIPSKNRKEKTHMAKTKAEIIAAIELQMTQLENQRRS